MKIVSVIFVFVYVIVLTSVKTQSLDDLLTNFLNVLEKLILDDSYVNLTDATGPSPQIGNSPSPSSGQQTYCPGVDDLVVAYGNATLKDGGWIIGGGGGAATKAAFNIIGGSVEFDVDLSGVPGGVNANMYSVSPKFASNSAGFTKVSDYCDGSLGASKFCVEMDWLESNGGCGGASTYHTIKGKDNGGCNSNGCQNTFTYNNQPTFHMKISYDQNGAMTVGHHDTSFNTFNPQPGSDDLARVVDAYVNQGAVVYSSVWTGWVPLSPGSCPGNAPNTDGSYYVVSNLKITGTVVQGPTPRLCSASDSTGMATSGTNPNGNSDMTPPATSRSQTSATSPTSHSESSPSVSSSSARSPIPSGSQRVSPAPSASSNTGQQKTYCPTKDDLFVAYGNATLKDGGWIIGGGGGAATKAAFNIIGGSVEFDVDLSGVPGGVNANMYSISPKFSSNSVGFSKDDYCDGSMGASKFCVEMDWLESNGGCGGASTYHTIKGQDNGGCNSNGCQNTFTYNNQPTYHMKISYDQNGAMTVGHHDTSFNTFNPQPGSDDLARVVDAYVNQGAVVYSSVWTGWVPLSSGSCPGNAPNTDGSYYVVSNLKITGTVVQGPHPHTC